jgi:hypothetical protein
MVVAWRPGGGQGRRWGLDRGYAEEDRGSDEGSMNVNTLQVGDVCL